MNSYYILNAVRSILRLSQLAVNNACGHEPLALEFHLQAEMLPHSTVCPEATN